MSTAPPLVRAILVTDGRSDHLPAVFEALQSQRRGPDILHVVLTHGAPHPDVPESLRALVTVSEALSVHEAIDEVLDSHVHLPREYLWLLHDDTAPLPEALAALVATARKRRRAGVVGGAHVRWHDTNRLVNLGTTVSRIGARRVNLVDEDDVNQGQYHDRDDVLAVSLAAALVRRDVWLDLGGTDAAYGGFGDSVDFCRRAWGRGYDVVIVPTAKIRHSQESLYGRRERSVRGRRASYVSRRTGEWYHALAWAPVWAVPMLVLWAWASAPARALGRIAQNTPRLAGAELVVPWVLLRRLRHLPASRRAAARAATVPATQLRRLFAGLRTIAHHVRSREWGDYERWRAQSAPSDVVKVELAALAGRRRRALGVVVVAAATVSAFTTGAWLQALVSGQMLTGSGLGVTDVGTRTLVDRVWTGWSEHGLGAPALDGAWAALMLPLSVFPGGARWGVGLVLVGGAVWASLGAWAATGAATRVLSVRVIAALVYGLWPVHLEAIADGRLGPVIAHAVLPWVVFGVARAAGWQHPEVVGDGELVGRARSSPSAAMGAAVALVVVTTAAPVLLVPAVIALMVVGFLARRHRWRMWWIAVPSLVVATPALVASVSGGLVEGRGWQVLLRDSGPVLTTQSTPPWQTLLGQVDVAPQSVEAVATGGGAAAAALVALVAVLALVGVAARPRAGAVISGWAWALVGAALAIVLPRLVVVNADGAGHAAVTGWPGAGHSLLALGLLMAVTGATAHRTGPASPPSPTESQTDHDPQPGGTPHRPYVGVATVVIGLTLAAHAGLAAWPREEPAPQVWTANTAVLPLVAALEQDVDTRQRVLTLSQDDTHDLTFSVLDGDGTSTLTGRAHRDAQGVPHARAGDVQAGLSAHGSLAEAVAQLAGGQRDAVADLAAWGIGVVVVAPDSEGLNTALEQIPGVTLMGASDHGTSWRVERAQGAAPVSRAWLTTVDGEVAPLPYARGRVMAGVDTDDESVILLAAPADPAWRATLDGVLLESAPDVYGRAAFHLPAADGTLTIRYRDLGHQWWLWSSIVVVGWALLGSVPIHARRDAETRS